MFEAINIRNYVNGDGTDETAGFIQALAAAVNKTLLIENITIKLNPQLQPFINGFGRAIEINGGERRITGSNAKFIMVPSVVPRGHADYPRALFLFGNCDLVEISGIEIDMQSHDGDYLGGVTPLMAVNCTRVEWHHNYIHHNGFTGMSTQDGHDVRIYNNEIDTTDAAIFVVGQPTGRVRITDNYIKGGSSEGIGLFNSSHNSTDADLAQNWVISGNTIQDKNSYGMNITALNGIVDSNTITGCLGGIFFYGGIVNGQDGSTVSKNITVTNNRITDCEFGINNIGSGFVFENNSFKSIRKRSLSTNNYENLPASFKSYNVKICNNHFEDTNTEGWEVVNLYNLVDSVFSNNQFYNTNSSYRGIFVKTCENLLIENNFARNTSFTLAYETNMSIPNFVRDNFFADLGMLESNDTRGAFPAVGSWIFENNILTNP